MNPEETAKAIPDWKLLKSKHKMAFTKLKNKLLQLLDVPEDEELDKRGIRKLQNYLDDVNEDALSTIHKLCSAYREVNDPDNEKKTMEELDVLEREYICLESLNGQVKMCVDAATTHNVTGSLEIFDWNRQLANFEHLKGLKIPVCRKNTADLLIGVGYANLHCSLHEIRGKPGEPVARLTPLGWTCVGPVESDENVDTRNFHSALFVGGETELDKSLERFWEIEHIPLKNSTLSTENKMVMKTVESSLECNNRRYSVLIPWNDKIAVGK